MHDHDDAPTLDFTALVALGIEPADARHILRGSSCVSPAEADERYETLLREREGRA